MRAPVGSCGVIVRSTASGLNGSSPARAAGPVRSVLSVRSLHPEQAGLLEAKGVYTGYVSRAMRLALLAPDIVEAILDGRQPKGLRLAELLGNGPVVWEEQRQQVSSMPAQ